MACVPFALRGAERGTDTLLPKDIPWPPATDPPGSLLHDLLTRFGWLHHAHHGNATAVQPVSPEPVIHTDPGCVLPRALSTELEFVEQPPYAGDGPAPDAPDDDLPVDANFWYFLLFCASPLSINFSPGGTAHTCEQTTASTLQLPSSSSPNSSTSTYVSRLPYLSISLTGSALQRLNWWPAALGGTASYVFFWLLSLSVGFLLHHFDLDGFGRRTRSRRPEAQEWDWERKTTWVLLAFATMALPALACFTKLRADRRNSYRRSLTPAQKT